MFVRRTFGLLSALAITALTCFSSSAALISGDYLAPGDHLLVQDTGTGLEWLTMGPTRGPLQTSQGVSVNQILNGFGGYIQSGFQFATLPQVQQLFVNSGISDFSGTYGSNDVAGAQLLNTLFGNVNAGQAVGVVQGFAGVDIGAGTALVPAVVFIAANTQYNQSNQDIAAAFCISDFTGCVFGLDTTPSVGAFLVRSTNASQVPEPASQALVALGLCLLILVRRRRFELPGFFVPAVSRKMAPMPTGMLDKCST